MQNDIIEELTAEEMRMIDRMSVSKVLALLHYCAEERLALATVDEYISIQGGKRRTVYQSAKDGNIMKYDLCGHLYLVINDK